MSTLVLRDAELDGVHVDVRVEGAKVERVGPPGTVLGADVVIECDGGALLPGLHDHHLHLLSMAAALESVDVASNLDQVLRVAHASTAPGAGIRAVHYDERHEGALDRWRLDALAPGRAVRVQHRSGAMWVLSTAALAQVGAEDAEEPGIERDRANRPTGRMFRLDDWLHARLPPEPSRDLTGVGRRLASCGVTGVTDCTPTASVDYFETVADAARTGALPLTVWTTGGPALSETRPPEPLHRGPVKVLITDHEFPPFDEVIEWFRRAHEAERPVAVHCVTRAALLFALSAWHEAGSAPGDRIEHASVTTPEDVKRLAELSLTVVTQPSFIVARGDAYLSEVEPADRPHLYRCASLLEAGVGVAGSTDAPFGPDDPWIAVQAAIHRRSQRGFRVGADRGLAPLQALRLFLAAPESPGGPIRRIRPGLPADLCLLDVPLRKALLDPSSRHVARTIGGGRCTFTA